MGKLSQSFWKIQILAVAHSYRYISTYNLNLPCRLHLYYIAVRDPENPNPVAWNGTVLLCCYDYSMPICTLIGHTNMKVIEGAVVVWRKTSSILYSVH